MGNQFKFISIFIFALGVNSAVYAAATTELDKADANQVNSACVQDAQTAGCSGDVVGKGLLRCLHNYKKANQSFKFTPACQSAMKQLHQDKKAGK